MVKIIEAKAIISAQDATGKAFADVLKKIDSLGKANKAFAASGAKDFGTFAKKIDELNTKAGAIDGFRAQQRAMITARQQFSAARADVERLGRAMRESASPTRELTREYDRAQRSVKLASAAWQDQVSSVKAAKAAVESHGISLRTMAKQESEIQRQIGRRSLNPSSQPFGPRPPRSNDHPTERRSSTVTKLPEKNEGTDNAGILGGFGLFQLVKDVVLSGMKVDSERSQMRQAGWTEKEIKTAEHRANRFSAEWGVSPSSSMGIIREARATFGGDLQQTLANVPDFFAVRTAMKQKSPNASDQDLDHQLGQIIKSGEILGYSKDPKRLKEFTNFATQMAQVFGSGLRGDEWLNYAKSGKTAAGSFDFEFLRSIMPTLLSEQGGDKVGTALQTVRGAMIGGRMKHAAVKNMLDLGLVNEDGVYKTKTGAIKGLKPGGVVGSDVLSRNPLEWYEKYLSPAMDKKGLTPEQRKTTLSGIASDRNVEYMFHLFEAERERMKKDRATVEKAQGLEGAKKALVDDPNLAVGRTKASAENASASVADNVMEPLKNAAGSAADALNSLAESARGNPNTAATGGVLGAIGGGVAALMTGGGWLRTGLGIAGGGFGGALGLPFLIQQALDGDPKRAARARTYGQLTPEDWEQARRRTDFVRRDPEAARGEAFQKLTAKVESPIPVDVTGKVNLDPSSKVDVGVTIKVQGEAKVTGQSVTSSGNARGSVGTSTAGDYGTP